MSLPHSAGGEQGAGQPNAPVSQPSRNRLALRASQAGVAEALTCPLGVVVERAPCQGPSCEHPVVLGRPDPSGAPCQSQGPAPALSPPRPGLGSIPLTLFMQRLLYPNPRPTGG